MADLNLLQCQNTNEQTKRLPCREIHNILKENSKQSYLQEL